VSGPIANLHVVFAVLSLAFGLRIFTTRRGTPTHRKLGYGYIVSMLVMNVAALLLYARTGAFGPFHVAALISLATLIAGAIPAILRRPQAGWLSLHWEFMSWSFVGLVAGAVAEAAFRIPGAAYWPAIAAGTIAAFVVGGTLIYRSRGAMRRWPGTHAASTRGVADDGN
jgi:uncharacterized membrane protein